MNAAELESKLAADYGCYFVNPQLFVPGSDKDAAILSPADFMKVFEKDSDKISKCVRRRAEKIGTFSYYAVWSYGGGYMKTSVPTAVGAGAGGFLDNIQVPFTIKQLWDTFWVRLGLF